MENKLLQEVREDVKDLVKVTHEMDVKLAEYNAHLEEHMRRTEANEKQIQELKNFKWFFAGISTIALTVVEILRRFV